MLSFLLDEQISPEVAQQIKRKRAEIPIYSIHMWQEGRCLGIADEVILMAATEAGLTLVSYDLKTIPPILYKWGEAGTEHGGIIFVDDKSIPPSNFGGLVRSLILLWDTEQEMDWKNRIFYLQLQL